MPGSNIIHLDAYRTAGRADVDPNGIVLPLHPVLPAVAVAAMGFAFWSNVLLLPAHASLALLEAWSRSIED
jgi:hypothetical protein